MTTHRGPRIVVFLLLMSGVESSACPAGVRRGSNPTTTSSSAPRESEAIDLTFSALATVATSLRHPQATKAKVQINYLIRKPRHSLAASQ
ncbi:hypothetical protein HDV57DRAFT_502102 [Trichoderma longibrachiatum]